MPRLATNKQAGFEFDLKDRLEAGIQLTGPEVKSVKRGEVNMKGSYVSIRTNDIWLVNCYISPYKPAAAIQTNYSPTRERKLLIHKKEAGQLAGLPKSRGLTIVPISFYTKGAFIKVELAVARGKKQSDKRASIKKREVDRNIKRALKQDYR
ncbi:MAG: SsrA-binding protein SmpB [bacterium]